MRWLTGALVGLALSCSTPAPRPRASLPQPKASTSSAALAPTATPIVEIPVAPTAQAGVIPAEHQERIDAVVMRGVAQGHYPGAVVLVQRDGHTVFQRAYGSRSLVPTKSAMQTDTVFDLASLTKPVATATAVMILRDQGKLMLDDSIQQHLAGCPLRVTLAELLTHRSGLPAANALQDYRGGRAAAISAICAKKLGRRGRELYSDLGYILLAEMVAQVSGQPFAAFCQEHIFAPLAMTDTAFVPDEAHRIRSAPTEERAGVMLQGHVHDPRAAALDGVAGHAGLFSTAHDLGRWADMLLGGGELSGKRVLSAASVADMLVAKTPRTMALARSVVGGVAHTGFTGTSVWLDPAHHTALVILASRLHAPKGDVAKLRQDVRAVVLDANRTQDVKLGVDVLRAAGFAQLAGKNVGLITNVTGRARDGTRTADLLHGAPNVTLRALFAPEHGMSGTVEGTVGETRDVATGLVVHSLYGENPRATAEQLRDVDTLVFDVQSIGARFYTYVTTLGYALETAAKHDVELVVLDRPNPIGGTVVEGPVLERGRESFVGYHALPVRHGMTVGELARLFNEERKIGARLTVIESAGWRRSQTFADTGLPWTHPSPNIQSPEAALLYPGLALLEMTNVSVGRGTDAPFTRVGAPWMNVDAVLAELEGLAGVAVVADAFTPSSSRYPNTPCRGVRFTVTDPAKLQSVRLGLALTVALQKHHRGQWQTTNLITLLGHQPTVNGIVAGRGVDELIALGATELAAFEQVRARYLLYP